MQFTFIVIRFMVLASYALVFSNCGLGKPSTKDLMVAIANGQESEVKSLIDRGADVNSTNADGVTPLMLAAAKGSPGSVKVLLANGANPNAKDGEGMTALMFAAWMGKSEVVDPLVDKGADVNSNIEVGKAGTTKITALKIAGLRGKGDFSSAISRRGASSGGPDFLDFSSSKKPRDPFDSDSRILQADLLDCFLWIRTKEMYVDTIIDKAGK